MVNCWAVIPVRVDLKRGITIFAEVDANEFVIDYCTKFQKQFNEKGIFNIQCILTEHQEVFPFEVNPRVSTTFCLAISRWF